MCTATLGFDCSYCRGRWRSSGRDGQEKLHGAIDVGKGESITPAMRHKSALAAAGGCRKSCRLKRRREVKMESHVPKMWDSLPNVEDANKAGVS